MSSKRNDPGVGRPSTDRVLRQTRWLAAFIVPFLLAAFVLTYVLPERNSQLFAWNLRPRLSSMMLGAAYLGGAYFFTRAALSTTWHSIKAGFLPVVVFAGTMGLATALHWDSFAHGHLSFVAWVALYFTTPFLVFAVWWRNRRTESTALEADDAVVPAVLRRLLLLAGVATVVIAALLFIRPDVVERFWPWQVTPLTSRVLSGLFGLSGVEEICVALDRRWSAMRIVLHSQLVALVAIGVAVVISWGDLRTTFASTWIFVVGMAATLVVVGGLSVVFDLRRLRGRTAA